MWKPKKKWEKPGTPWNKENIEHENILIRNYGLKNKKELWKAQTIARKIRFYIRYLNAQKAAGFDVIKEEERIRSRLVRLKILNKNSDITEALGITEKDILERRLQTLVYRKGLAKTIKQARQLVVHKHIMVGDKVISSPSYLVKEDEEDKIRYNEYSNISKDKLFKIDNKEIASLSNEGANQSSN
ncbi:30S ribosomal protein S4 [Nanobdella aerobiophila]|uniref:30S ribosomal protein S4 n=1 Tax=Nanobdella aerobiophila TaxID=2586965 RepID=A0A915SSI4_9ARCH|nr:30S ribosomal protein S4 [Nanobdella aerobiophila]BBL45426.1 30S ribosomal protein S4 [Nanobdella aerobiophila]